MKIQEYLKLSAAAAALCTACDFGPLDEDVAERQYRFVDLAEKQYRFAAVNLDAYFIYRNSLPPDFFTFPSPDELYLSVHDPYTAFYGSEEVERVMSQLSTSRGGIGIAMDSVETGYLITNVIEGSPGEKAGLAAFDTIIGVGDTSIAAMQWPVLQKLLKGEIGDTVVLKIKRGDSLLNVVVVLGTFSTPSVVVDTVESTTAMIRLEGFFQKTTVPGGSAQEFSEALAKTMWADRTIIDLRGNGGGYIDQCMIIVNELVPQGTPIIVFRRRDVDEKTDRATEYIDTIVATGPGSASEREFYILVDRMTASASEIMVSCLMQREGVTVIGDTTFGKGCGQVLIQNGPGGVMARITCMTIHPAGKDVAEYNQVGIVPDIFSDSTDAVDVALSIIEGVAPAKRRVSGVRRQSGRYDVSIRLKEPWGLFH